MRIVPRTTMSESRAKLKLLEFLANKNEIVQRISKQEAEDVTDAVLSIKKHRLLNSPDAESRKDAMYYDKIKEVVFDTPEKLGLGNFEAVHRNGGIYVNDADLFNDYSRFRLVSMLFHESEHCLQFFKMQESAEDFGVLKSEKNVPNFTIGNELDHYCEVTLHRSEFISVFKNVSRSLYFNQKKEKEAFRSQFIFTNELLLELEKSGSEMLKTYEFLQKYCITNRHMDPAKLAFLKSVLDDENGYLNHCVEELARLQSFNGVSRYNEIVRCLEGIIQCLFFSYHQDVADISYQAILTLPERSYDNICDKMLLLDNLQLSTDMPMSKPLLLEVARLNAKLANMPENVLRVDEETGARILRYDLDSFKETYAFVKPEVMGRIYHDATRVKGY